MKIENLNKNPFVELKQWLEVAEKNVYSNHNAMALSTLGADKQPRARMVLLRGLSEEKGLYFYTNYQSDKGSELIANPKASALFYWRELDQQIRVEGSIEKASNEESDNYWKNRPLKSQINASLSDQSKEITNWSKFKEQVLNETNKAQGLTSIPRPAHWGGFILKPQRFEFWKDGEFRLHDRFIYIKAKNSWDILRLQP